MEQRTFYRIESGIRVASGLDVGGQALPMPSDNTHVLLVHNLFPNYGSHWIQQWPGPVVTILHNFRYICANGLLLRDGRLCTACVGQSTLPALRYSCYRNSRLATMPLAIANYKGPVGVTPLSRADVIVAQSEQAQTWFERAGASRISLVPGFGPTVVRPVNEAARAGWVFVGRLSSEKGLLELLGSWPDVEPLDVIGEGPERAEAERHAPRNVRFLGEVPHREVLRMYSNYRGLLFPGKCIEGAHPMVIREALAAGTPIVASDSSSAAELLRRHGGGVIYSPESRSSLRAALDRVATNHELGQEAHVLATQVFSKHRWQQDMATVLRSAQARRQETQNAGQCQTE